MRLQFSFDETCRLIPRRIRALDDATIIATRLLACFEEVESAVPADLLARFGELKQTMGSRHAGLEEVAPPRAGNEPVVPPEPDPALLEITTAEVLGNHNLLNYEIDRHINSVESVVSGAAMRPASHPKGEAARLLGSVLFPDGRGFLKLAGPKQWLEVHLRFDKMSAQEMQAAQLLGIDDQIEDIRSLNGYYGKLLNITEADVETPEVANISEKQTVQLDAFHELLSDMLSFVNVAWPGLGEVNESNRRRMLGPYFDRLIELSKEAGKRVKPAETDTDDANTDVSTDG